MRPAREPRRGLAAAGVMLAGLLAAGCARGPAGPQRPSVESCAEFGISAIQHRVTVTSLPAACRGLTRAQVNLAVGQALYAMTSNVHGKAQRRARARELSPLLGQLVTTVPAQRSLPPAPAPAAGQASGPSLGLAALISWLITVGLGSWMMARWITRGGFRRARLSKAGLPPSLIFTHFGLAVAGLLVWGAYLATGLAAAAWAGCVLLLPVAGLGMALVSLWLPERSLAGHYGPGHNGPRPLRPFPRARQRERGPYLARARHRRGSPARRRPASARPDRGGAWRVRRGDHPVRAAGRGRLPLSGGGGPPGPGLAVGLVLEGDLQLRPVDDPAILVEVYVLPDHLGDADVADGLAHGPHRFRRGFLPRVAARPDDVDDLVHTHDGLLHGWMVARCANILASLCIRRAAALLFLTEVL